MDKMQIYLMITMLCGLVVSAVADGTGAGGPDICARDPSYPGCFPNIYLPPPPTPPPESPPTQAPQYGINVFIPPP